MADAIGASSRPRERGASGTLARLAAPAALVVAFWWGATGLTIVAQREGLARGLALGATTLLAVAGALLVRRSRDERSPRAARAAFLGAALLWWWTATLFYTGWGVAPAAAAAGPPRSLALAAQAIAATWRVDAVAVAALAAVALAVWRRPNRMAFWSLLAFWGTLQTAKLNVFAGVRNPGAELLPPRLAGLRVFFGPAVNSPLLAATTLALGIASALLLARAARARDPFGRQGAAMLGVLLALAVLEHALLGVRGGPPLWDVFLRVRG